MELDKRKKAFFFFTHLTTFFIVTLGAWWVYLMFKYFQELERLGLETQHKNLARMIKWEGFSFFILLFILAIVHSYMQYLDQKRAKSTRLFFASLTHELKTPLASIKLQSQVLEESIKEMNIDNEHKRVISKYLDRLENSRQHLEDEFDKHLQLAKIERQAHFHLTRINLIPIIEKQLTRYPKLNISVPQKDFFILADQISTQTVFRNLFENISKHAQHNHHATITINECSKYCELTIDSMDSSFCGNVKKLGQLFYKYNSPSGSGLGLYICKKLMRKMRAKISFSNEKTLKTHLRFLKAATS